jgi:antitoxin MazE
MRTSVVRVGNSRGIRIPKPLLEQCAIGEEVDLSVDGRKIILKAIPGRKKRPRAGWAEALREMHAAGDDRLLLPDAIDAEMDDWAW